MTMTYKMICLENVDVNLNRTSMNLWFFQLMLLLIFPFRNLSNDQQEAIASRMLGRWPFRTPKLSVPRKAATSATLITQISLALITHWLHMKKIEKVPNPCCIVRQPWWLWWCFWASKKLCSPTCQPFSDGEKSKNALKRLKASAQSARFSPGPAAQRKKSYFLTLHNLIAWGRQFRESVQKVQKLEGKKQTNHPLNSLIWYVMWWLNIKITF